MGGLRQNRHWKGLLRRCFLIVGFGFSSIIYHPASSIVYGAQLPSLFRGVVVVDSDVGVRVVSVEETSQAYLADLRPDDLIIRIQDTEVHSIDEFSTVSSSLKGTARVARVLVFREGAPQELTVHVYSYPVLQHWGVEFIPEHDLRFAQPETGRDYWARMGRGFTEAGKWPEAMNAYLNALHHMPADTASAMQAADVACRLGAMRLRSGALEEGLSLLRHGVLVMERLFDEPLTEEELRRVKDRLRETVEAIRAYLQTRQASSTLEPTPRSVRHFAGLKCLTLKAGKVSDT